MYNIVRCWECWVGYQAEWRSLERNCWFASCVCCWAAATGQHKTIQSVADVTLSHTDDTQNVRYAIIISVSMFSTRSVRLSVVKRFPWNLARYQIISYCYRNNKFNFWTDPTENDRHALAAILGFDACPLMYTLVYIKHILGDSWPGCRHALYTGSLV